MTDKQITGYCAERAFTARHVCELYRQVCAGVQFAHQNLIVHRDLKPSNILVTGDGTPKLLDFGIAKIMDTRERGVTAYTQPMMTLDYASPEQVRGEAITTATDVYLLGAVLYEILTGRRPHDLKSASPMEVERVICQQEVAAPSTVAASARLRKDLPGDLDNIIGMAMRMDPQPRYQSVQQFSEDLRPYLPVLPVIARPDRF